MLPDHRLDVIGADHRLDVVGPESLRSPGIGARTIESPGIGSAVRKLMKQGRPRMTGCEEAQWEHYSTS